MLVYFCSTTLRLGKEELHNQAGDLHAKRYFGKLQQNAVLDCQVFQATHPVSTGLPALVPCLKRDLIATRHGQQGAPSSSHRDCEDVTTNNEVILDRAWDDEPLPASLACSASKVRRREIA